MLNIKYSANGCIITLIENFDNKIEEFYFSKINILEQSEDESIYDADLKLYKRLKSELKDILLEMVDINTEIFIGTLTEVIDSRFEKYFYIINLK